MTSFRASPNKILFTRRSICGHFRFLFHWYKYSKECIWICLVNEGLKCFCCKEFVLESDTVIWPWSWQKLETLSNNVLHLFNVPICHPRFAQFKMSVKIYDKDYVILRKLFIIPFRSCSLTFITGQIQYNQRINFGDLPITPTLIGRLPMFCLKNLFLRLSELREIICRIKTQWYVKL